MSGASRVRRLLLAAVLTGAALLAASAAPVAAQARIRTSVDTTLVTVGDRVTLTVRVEHPSDASVVWPDSIDVAPFEVVGAQLGLTTESADGIVSTARFSVAAFELGELELPSFAVEVLRADGSSERLETDRFGIEVVSVGTDEGGDIREIRGPLSIPVGALRLALLALLFVLLGAAVVVAWRRWRKGRDVGVPVQIGPPPRPPHELALEALDRLAASPLLERGEVKEWHIEASEIVRRWIEAELGVRALEMTTWEIIEGMDRADAPPALRDDLRRLLEQCDRVKFAKVRPDAEASRAVVERGRAVIRAGVAWKRAHEAPAVAGGGEPASDVAPPGAPAAAPETPAAATEAR